MGEESEEAVTVPFTPMPSLNSLPLVNVPKYAIYNFRFFGFKSEVTGLTFSIWLLFDTGFKHPT